MFLERYRSTETSRFIDTLRVGLPEGATTVAQEEVVDCVTGISEFYRLPVSFYERGRKIPAFRVTDKVLIEKVEKAGIIIDGKGVGILTHTQPIPVILLNQHLTPRGFDSGLRHELIHGMEPLGSNRAINSSNEAVVSVLETARRLKHLPFFDKEKDSHEQQTVYGAVARHEQGITHGPDTADLLSLMMATYFSENPLTPQRLAQHYFSGGIHYQDLLEEELRSNMPLAWRESFEKHFRIFHPRGK